VGERAENVPVVSGQPGGYAVAGGSFAIVLLGIALGLYAILAA
jgi:hypothetical protein